MDVAEFLASEEGQAAVADAAAKEVSGLKSKNGELLEKMTGMKDRLKSLDGIDPEQYQQLVEFKNSIDEAERKKLMDGGDSEKIIEQMKNDHASERESLVAERDALKEENRKLVIGQAMSEAMAQAEIAGPFQEAFMAMLSNKIAVSEDDEGKHAVVGDKTVAEYVEEFVGSDAGKHFVKAPTNSGSGAHGSKGGEPAGTNPFAGEAPDLSAGAALMRSDPQKARRLMKEAGMPAAEDRQL